MQNTFSSQLIARAQRIFEKRSGRSVSEEEAEICLEKIAQLGLLAVKVMEQTRKEVRSHGKNQ